MDGSSEELEPVLTTLYKCPDTAVRLDATDTNRHIIKKNHCFSSFLDPHETYEALHDTVFQVRFD